MKNNVQSDVKIPKSGYRRSKFNWSHDINTTFGWGEVQPTECKLLVPNSKTVVNNKGLVRFAPMLDPTFGRVHYKSFSQFVPLEDVFPNLGSFLSREPVTNGFATKVSQKLPNVPLAHLSAWAFTGARATMYFAIGTNDGKTAAENAALGNYITWYRQNPERNSVQSDWEQYFDRFQDLSRTAIFLEVDQWQGASNDLFPITSGLSINLERLGEPYTTAFGNGYGGWLKLGSKSYYDLCPVRRDYQPDLYDGESSVKSYQREVTFESADYVLEFHVFNDNEPDNGIYGAIAFEFSDYGKRIRKIIQGCGYQISLTSIDRVSILPLLAQYKAYFDVFGLQLYQGWETTWAYKWIKEITYYFREDLQDFAPKQAIDYSVPSNFNSHMFMLLELADEWYTDRPDFFGAHFSSLAVSPAPDTLKFISVDNSGNLKNGANIGTAQSLDSENVASGQKQAVNSETGDVVAGNSYLQTYINQLCHSQVDATLLQRLTRWVNKYSLLGRAIDKILRAFGLGKYLDKIDSTFIGNTDKMLTISDVVSMAETDLATLGEYGGKGLEYFEEGKMVFENDVYGYWITLSCVVPEAGYTQNIDLTLRCLSMGDMYQADFDAIGFEATSKEDFVAAQSIGTIDPEARNRHTFGFVPRQSKWKVHKNLVNGDFNRHGLRDVYLPYTLDKQLNINDYDVDVVDYRNPEGALIYNFVRLNRSKKAYSVPVAGNWARTPTKYAWLGNFDRIFRKLDNERTVQESDNTDLKQLVGITDYNRDNFMFHCISSMTCYAPMKPIEESYQVEDDDNPSQSGVEYVNKA